MALNEIQKIERSEYLEKNLVITECSQKKNYVFISYASDNWETVFKKVVVPLQENYGLHVYADKAFDKVNEKWIVPMLRNVRGSDAVVLFISQKYIESYACFLELLTAVNAKKPIVFVSLEEDLHLGDTTDQPEVEPGVKKEILNQGANISTITNNTSNDLMRAMKSAYTSISTLLEQDALSKYDISDAFINFFRDAQANKKTVNDLIAVKDTISSISDEVYDKKDIEERKKIKEAEEALKAGVASVISAAPVTAAPVTAAPVSAAPALQQAVPPVNVVTTTNLSQPAEPEKKKSKTIPIIIGTAVGGVLLIGVVVILIMLALGIGVFAGAHQNANNGNSDIQEVAENNQGQEEGINTSSDWDLEKMDNVVASQNTQDLSDESFAGLNGWQRVEHDDGSTYIGEMTNGFNNGFGVERFGNGNVYAGEWNYGASDGYGAYLIDESIYFGKYNNNYPDGWGAIVYTNGIVEFGERTIEGNGSFLNGHLISFGTSDSSFYAGEVVHDVHEGWGSFMNVNGDIYYGEWTNGRCTGLGVYVMADGSVKSGEWNEDVFTKPSELLKKIEWDNGDIYYGEVVNGLPNGHGVLLDAADKITRAGEWVDGDFTGFGTEYFTNGDIRSGFYTKGLADGVGAYVWADRGFRAGSYQFFYGDNVLEDGYGMEGAVSDGNYQCIYAGEYTEGKMTGRGARYFSDRTIYGGEFVDGLYTGRGTMIHGDGTIETGLWEENNLVGD